MDYEDHIFKQVENDTVDLEDLSESSNQFIAEEIILTIFALAGISANILLIYIICYYKKLQTNINIYLVNWAITDSGSAIITLSCFRIFSSFLEVSDSILCFYFGLGFALLFNEMLFMILITTDWCLSSYLPRPLTNFRKYTHFILAVVWILSTIYFLTSSFLCSSSSNYYLIFHVTLPLEYGLLTLSICALYFVYAVRKCKKQFEYHPVSMLLIPTAFMACWFLSWINLLFLDLSNSFYLLTETPLFLHPTINLLLLVYLNDDFKTCFFQVVKCPRNLFKLKSENNGGNVSDNTDRTLSFDNRTFDHINRHV